MERVNRGSPLLDRFQVSLEPNTKYPKMRLLVLTNVLRLRPFFTDWLFSIAEYHGVLNIISENDCLYLVQSRFVMSFSKLERPRFRVWSEVLGGIF